MRLICRTSIDCAHNIEDSDELLTKKCAEEHGHTYNIEVKLPLELLAKFYEVSFVDFQLIKQDIVDKIIGAYDHQNITKKFKIHTVEELAYAIKKQILAFYWSRTGFGILHNPDELITVTIFETAKWGVEL